MEFLIKHILNVKNKQYRKTHDILELLGCLGNTGFVFGKHDELELLGSTITSWEEGPHYGSGVRTSTQTVNGVLKIIDSINEAFLQEQSETQDMKIFN